MVRLNHPTTGFVIMVVSFAFGVPRTLGQANYLEGFDGLSNTQSGDHGPPELIAAGWEFRNQSNPIRSGDWRRSPVAHQGQWSLGVDWSVGWWDDNQSEMSSWAILPAIPNQIAGDVIRFFTSSGSADSFDPTAHLEVHYSPSGGTSTGSNADQVGDFTVLLLDLPDLEVFAWTEHQATLPGSGRIALRFHIPPSNLGFPTFSGDFDIDTLSVGPAGPACNIPPVPIAGQTVTWTAAESPYTVCELLTIPAGGTVIVEPGVVVNVDPSRRIVVSGTLLAQGTAAQHVVIDAPAVFPPMITVNQGTLNAAFLDFRGQLRVESGGTLDLVDCDFAGNGLLWSQELQLVPPWIHLQHCTFTNSLMVISDALGILEDNTFVNSNASVLRGFVDLRGTNTVTGLQMDITLLREIQTRVIDGVHASGVPDAAGLALRGGNYLLGPNNVLQGNRYTLELNGGLDPQSVVPLTGNTINAIDALNGSGPTFTRWADFGIPYRLTEGTPLGGGFLTIDPGVTIEAEDPTAGMRLGGSQGPVFMGLPDAPITFRAAAPGGAWQGLIFNSSADSGQHLEYVNISDAFAGAISQNDFIYVSNCVFENNQLGANTNSFGITYFDGTRFINNGTGVDLTPTGHAELNSPLNPNSFEGNGTGIDSASSNDARNCWWNDPTGPQASGNPGGQGDSIVGPVSYQPFLSTPPNFADVPPVVRLVDPGYHWTRTSASVMVDFTLVSNEKYIIRWDAIGDDIDHFRIEYSPNGHIPPSQFSVVADDLPQDQRSYEWTIPAPSFANSQFVKVIGVDAAGQEGFDQTPIVVPSDFITGELTITTDLTGMTLTAGEDIPDLHWSGSVSGFPTITPLVVLENEGRVISGLNISGVGQFFVPFPNINTDRARLAVQVWDPGNSVRYFFADGYFSIRHDPRLGFVPPTVTLLAPNAGDSFPGGSVVPITWTASAAEGLHSFDILASYNGGRTWHPIVRDLPSSARSYNWLLPASTGIADARVHVIARDLRFQNTSDGDDRSFTITPGDAGLPGDFDGDGDVDIFDFSAFLDCVTGPGGGVPPGCATFDFDADDDVDFVDNGQLLLVFTGS